MGRLSAIILVLVLVTALLRIEFLFYLVYMFIGIYVWGRWITPRGLKKLRVARVFADHAFLGEEVAVTIRLQNESRLALPWLELVESAAMDLRAHEATNDVLALRGGEKAEFTYTVRATRRGQYRIGPMFLSSGDLFGFFDKQRRKHAADFITVYPRINALAQLGLPSRLPFGAIASTQRLFEDPTRPAGVRDYRPGDPLRRINWKVSGHQQRLVVKTFQPAISLDSVVLLNLHRDDYDERQWRSATEWSIELAASFAAHLVQQRQAVGLITNGVDSPRGASKDSVDYDEWTGRARAPDAIGDPTVPPPILPRAGRDHLMKILERLARIEADDTVPFAQWAGSACMSLGWGVTILAITATADEATCNTLHRLVRAGFNPILFVVEPHHRVHDIRERARRLGFSAYQVAKWEDLDPWRRRQAVSI